MNFECIGKRIRKYRVSQKISQEFLAEKSGISVSYLGQIERGERIPAFETFIGIINALGVSADMVLCDIVPASYEVKNSLLNEKLNKLSEKDRARIYDVIDTLIKHSLQVKP